MNKRLRRLCLVLIGGVMILFCFSGCSSNPASVIPPQGMTPVETVQFYFEQWNNKSANGMDSVVRDEMKNADFGLSNLVYVKLTVCIDENEEHMIKEGAYFSKTYPGYIEYAVINVEFEVEYRKSLFSNNTGGI